MIQLVTTKPLRTALAVLGLVFVLVGCAGEHQGPGVLENARIPATDILAREARNLALRPDAAKQILFGDLHVHTTFSPDAFLLSLPLMGGSGAHPPADACDYARHCSALDFWSINDHAEGLTPLHWAETIDSIRQCNEVAGAATNPDMVAFVGWEWSQVGNTPATHFGHKNVILRGTGDADIPVRPIAAPRPDFRVPPLPAIAKVALPILGFARRQEYFDYFTYQAEVEATRLCPAGIPTRELPDDCHEIAYDPAELFAKLDAWDVPALVIPHGTAWGLMTPPGTSWENQRGQRHPRQKLIEIYSGHGSSEEFRDWQETDAGNETARCPEPQDDYLPCCWQAGELIRARCGDLPAQLCEERVHQARVNYTQAGTAGHNTVPGASVEDWLDCGQCTDCFLPAYNLRPKMSAQYANARDFRFGFIGSSDTHAAHAGNGFKEHARRDLSEARTPSGPMAAFAMPAKERTPESVAIAPDGLPLQYRRYTERGASFLVTGGIAAVHARGRDREAIFAALERRETYATSGDRILLFFDLLNGPEGEVPMGAAIEEMRRAPRFRVAAAGAFEQLPGCPAATTETLGAERQHQLCLDECFHPGTERRRITRIEVVRIRMDAEPGGVGESIEDPWKVLPCPAGGEGCRVSFEDESFLGEGRPTAYYVRAIQEKTRAVNGGGLRCERDERGRCIRVEPCYAGERTPADDDCLAEVEERAWSSPIFLDPPYSN
ncbi:MAG: DUF3604 domain-containing protein [Deltaproteobacteria bacterium]